MLAILETAVADVADDDTVADTAVVVSVLVNSMALKLVLLIIPENGLLTVSRLLDIHDR